MPYAFIQDVPADENVYREIRAALGAEAPDGLIVHLVQKRDGGLRYIDVWSTEADWDRFREARLEPTVGAVLGRYGIPHDHSLVHIEPIDVIDSWLGETALR